MTSSVSKLLSIASPALSLSAPRLPKEYSAGADTVTLELLNLLRARNGFYAFMSALHVRPLSNEADDGLLRWNALEGWRTAYGGLADDILFFAEDIFGAQWGISDDSILSFDPETAERKQISDSLERWAQVILMDPKVATGWPLAEQWQQLHGPLPNGRRLVPKVPFALGGDFAVDNLFALEDSRAMRSYANIALQIHGLPNGTRVELRVTE